jgi:hypothetical protein
MFHVAAAVAQITGLQTLHKSKIKPNVFCHKMIFSSCPKVKLYFDGTAVNQEKATLGHAEGRLLIAGANSLVRASLLLQHKF